MSSEGQRSCLTVAPAATRCQTAADTLHTVMKCLSGEKTHAAINSELFRELFSVNNEVFEIELAKKQIEQREPIISGLFFLQ